MDSKITKRKVISAFFSISLFAGCAIFVSIRGYKCFEKYLKKPQAVDISFQDTRKSIFPSFTLCPFEPYKKKVLDECQINETEYKNGGPWVGNGNQNCTGGLS